MKKSKIELNKFSRKVIIPILDLIILPVCFLLTLMYYESGRPTSNWTSEIWIVCALFGFFYIVYQFLFRLYRSTWEFSAVYDFLRLFGVIVCSAVTAYLASKIIYINEEYSPPLFLTFCFSAFEAFAIMTGGRLALKGFFELHRRYKTNNAFSLKGERTMIIGAGWAGNVLVTELVTNESEYNPVCIVDDDISKFNKTIRSIPIVGTTKQIPILVKNLKISKIILAIPSLSGEARERILNICLETNCETRVIQYMHRLVETSNLTAQALPVRIEDLLGREPNCSVDDEVIKYIVGKVCLVTGGGGSIGSELCRQILSYQPSKLIIVDNYENTTFTLKNELDKYTKNFVVEICSVVDYDKMKTIFAKYKPNVVFHAAAHKHVPLMEAVPEQAIKNNVGGTRVICKLCNEFNSDRFVLISTDKAVNPTNVMGASKRCCELIMNYYSQISKHCAYCAVRFGNVLNSHGSVIPIFSKQIAEGGPVTVTHKDIVRYFMTIPEAVSLVLKTGCLADSGEIFVLDMGEQVKILSLAEKMIKLSGFEPYKDIKIKFVGLRPGEKLYEELLLSEEGITSTRFEKIFVTKPIAVNVDNFNSQIDNIMESAYNNDVCSVITQLKSIVPTFHPTSTWDN